MGKDKEPKWPEDKDHLNKTFLEELGHKMWNTKGTRFVASERLLIKNDLSNKAIGFLSAYLIIYGLFAVYQISGSVILDEKIIAFGSTTLSILLLVFTQIEAAQDYKLKALEFHKCALKISKLHDELRLFKTLKKHTKKDKIRFCEQIGKRYQVVLNGYSNHDSIDYNYFRATHKDYYKLSDPMVFRIKAYYYIRTKLQYHLLIGLPVIIFVLGLIIN